MDAADAFWAAKLVMRFDRPILEALVAKGRLSDPDAASYLVRTLLARRDKIGRAYLEALSPLDDFSVSPSEICAVDLGIVYGLARYGVVQALDEHGRVASEHTINQSGRACLPVRRGPSRYVIFRLRVVRSRDVKPALQVHFRAGERPRILGVIRVER